MFNPGSMAAFRPMGNTAKRVGGTIDAVPMVVNELPNPGTLMAVRSLPAAPTKWVRVYPPCRPIIGDQACFVAARRAGAAPQRRDEPPQNKAQSTHPLSWPMVFVYDTHR